MLLIYRNDGGLSLAAMVMVGAGPVDVAAADLNNDGLPDLVTANATGSNISVLLSDA